MEVGNYHLVPCNREYEANRIILGQYILVWAATFRMFIRLILYPLPGAYSGDPQIGDSSLWFSRRTSHPIPRWSPDALRFTKVSLTTAQSSGDANVRSMLYFQESHTVIRLKLKKIVTCPFVCVKPEQSVNV